MTIPAVGDVPTLTTDQMREVDRIMIEDLGIDLPRMMENAGRNLAWLSRQRFSPDSVIVLAGTGGNGGGGLVAARHLINRGVAVTVVPAGELGEVPSAQATMLRQMGAVFADEPVNADLVIDALIGYSLSGDPHGRPGELIEWANHQPSPVLALDVPSGLDTATGLIGDPYQGLRTIKPDLAQVGVCGTIGPLCMADEQDRRCQIEETKVANDDDDEDTDRGKNIRKVPECHV